MTEPQQTFLDNYNPLGIVQTTNPSFANPVNSLPTIYDSVSNPVSPQQLGNGYFANDIYSSNFKTGVSGWMLSYQGNFEGNNGNFRGDITGASGTFSGTLSGATIIGGIIETSSGIGQRVVIAGSDNTLRFYDSNNSQIIGIGANVGVAAIQMNLNSTINNCILISSSVAGFGFEYNNTGNIVSLGFVANLSGATNTGACAQLTNAGTTGAQGLLMTISNAATGILITHSSTGDAITINGSSVFNGFNLTNNISSGSPTGIIINETVSSSGSPNGVNISLSSASGTCTALVLSIAGSGSNSYLFSHAASGMIVSSAVGGSQNKKIRVNIGGAVYFIPLNDA